MPCVITFFRPIAICVLSGMYLGAIPAGTGADIDVRTDKWMTKYRDGVEKLAAFAKEIGASTTGVANAWVASHAAVSSVILGVSTLEQLQQNLKDADVTLTPEQRQQISGFFNTEVFEEAGGSFAAWRRRADIL
jgi:aryl-alcohol dehydrogenase-like predicted oxidoreductase